MPGHLHGWEETANTPIHLRIRVCVIHGAARSQRPPGVRLQLNGDDHVLKVLPSLLEPLQGQGTHHFPEWPGFSSLH